MVGGVAVANGSTLSTTGEMQVTCNVPYVLSVDGVEWVPTASAGGVDTYLLTSSGVVRIFINGTRYFIFSNVIAVDFVAELVTIDQMSENTRVSHEDVVPYYQGTLNEGVTGVNMFINVTAVSPTMSREDLIALGTSCVQGDCVVFGAEFSEEIVEITLRNFDITQYNAVYLGNVLLAFFEPRS